MQLTKDVFSIPHIGRPRSESMGQNELRRQPNCHPVPGSKKSYCNRLGGLVTGYNSLTFRRIRLPLSSGFLEPFNPHMIATHLRTHYKTG